jgi:hypothetical protein
MPTQKSFPYSRWLFVFSLILFLTTMGGQFFISDGSAMFRTTQSLVERGNWAVEPDAGLPQIISGADGQFYSLYDVGQPLFAVPFYWIARTLATTVPNGDVGSLTVFGVSLMPQIITALSSVVLYHVLYKLFGARVPALLTVVLWATGTLAWAYSKFYFPEALLTLYLLLAFDALLHADSSLFAALLAGLALGSAFSVRASAFIYVVPMLLFIVARARANTVRWTLAHYAAFFAGIVPFILIFFWHNQLRFGNIFLTGYQGQGFTTPFYVGFFGLLFSSGRSVFLYVPLLIPSLTFCLLRLRKQHPDLVVFVVAMLLTPVCFYASWWTWHGGWSWGPRFLVPALPFLLLPVGYVLAQSISRRTLTLILLCWLTGALINVAGTVINFNVYFVAVLQGDYNREALIWFDPGYSPIAAHWGYLLRGEALSWGETALANYALPPTVKTLYLPIMLGLLILWIAYFARQLLRRPAAESMETTNHV